MGESEIRESGSCTTIGWVVMAVGVISGILIILFLGRVEVASGYYGSAKVWSIPMIITGIGAMLNGFLVGYLFQKIGSLLRYHENSTEEKQDQVVQTPIKLTK